MPLFRSRSHFRVPTVKLWPVVIVVLAVVVVGGLAALALIEPRPPVQHFQVTVPNERFSR